MQHIQVNGAHHSFGSSTGSSYGPVNSHSRSESGTSQTQYDDHMTPPSKALMHDYTQPQYLMNGTYHNPPSARESTWWQNDPMAMHLLLETALGDSQQNEILPPEQLDALKSEEKALSHKIQARKKKLFLETRMANTSRSLQRLDRPGSNGSISAVQDSGRSDELAGELWRLERRQTELQNKHMKHTAAVLQRSYQTQTPTRDPPAEEDDYDVLDRFVNDESRFAPRLQNVSSMVYGMISKSSVNQKIDFPAPPRNKSVEDEITYIEQSLNTFRGLHEGLLTYLDETRKKARSAQTNPETETVLAGLWGSVETGQRDIERSLFSDAPDTRSEPFSLQAFSAKVQRMCDQATLLAQQQQALKDQWAQERSVLQTENDRAINDLQHATTTIDSFAEQLSTARALASKHEAAAQESSRQLSQMGSNRSDVDAALLSAKANLDKAQKRATDAEATATEKSKQLDKMQGERGDIEAELIRLQTELTVTRAELDGAYGVRAERSVEGTLTPQLKEEMEILAAKNMDLMQKHAEMSNVAEKHGRVREETEMRMQMLEKELNDLADAHESMVKQLVDVEKDRETLEHAEDGLKERIEELEQQAAEERIRVMGKSQGAPQFGKGDSTSIGVLRVEFRKMMQEFRTENMKSLKAERDEVRRLRHQLRAMSHQHNTIQAAAPQSSHSSPIITTAPSLQAPTLSAPTSLGKSALNRSISATAAPPPKIGAPLSRSATYN